MGCGIHSHSLMQTASTLGVEYHTAEQVQSGQFAFTAVEGGDYMTCFRAPEHHTTPTTLTIEFEWKTGIAAMDWSTVAKKGQVDVSVVPSLMFF